MEEDLETKYEEMRQDLEELGERLAELTAVAGKGVEKYGKKTIATLENKMDEMSQMMRDKRRKVNEFAYANPWKMTAMAAGVSFLLGLFLTRCRHKKMDM